jgi:hypothetical protein
LLKSDLDAIKKKAKEGNTSFEDIIEIVSEAFLSQSKHFNKIETTLKNIEQQLAILIYNVEKSSSPIYQILQDADEEEKQN